MTYCPKRQDKLEKNVIRNLMINPLAHQMTLKTCGNKRQSNCVKKKKYHTDQRPKQNQIDNRVEVSPKHGKQEKYVSYSLIIKFILQIKKRTNTPTPCSRCLGITGSLNWGQTSYESTVPLNSTQTAEHTHRTHYNRTEQKQEKLASSMSVYIR